jgi:single-strand DNA-binding protein
MPDTHVTITGNLTEDPELRYTPNGTPVANLRVAVTPRVKDGDAWKDGETSFFQVTAWRSLAENVAESLTKGARIMVYGRLQQRSWETPEGERRSVVEVQAEEVGPSLRWATAKPERTSAKATAGASKGGQFNDEPPF